MNQLTSWFRTVCRCENKLSFTTLRKCIILRTILVTVSVPSDDNRLGPSGNKTRNITDYNWLTENSAIEDVSNCAVW